jgi:hypothetical protein
MLALEGWESGLTSVVHFADHLSIVKFRVSNGTG